MISFMSDEQRKELARGRVRDAIRVLREHGVASAYEVIQKELSSTGLSIHDFAMDHNELHHLGYHSILNRAKLLWEMMQNGHGKAAEWLCRDLKTIGVGVEVLGITREEFAQAERAIHIRKVKIAIAAMQAGAYEKICVVVKAMHAHKITVDELEMTDRAFEELKQYGFLRLAEVRMAELRLNRLNRGQETLESLLRTAGLNLEDIGVNETELAVQRAMFESFHGLRYTLPESE